jgi:quercetin dioxygenase-like cupin family protein
MARKLRVLFAVVLVASVLAARGASAQSMMSRPLPDLEGRLLTLGQLVYAPGQSSEPHRHPAHIVAYVVSGQIESSLDDQPPVVYGPGDYWYESPMQLHRTFRNPSATEPVTVIVFGLRDPDRPGLIPESSPGAR